MALRINEEGSLRLDSSGAHGHQEVSDMSIAQTTPSGLGVALNAAGKIARQWYRMTEVECATARPGDIVWVSGLMANGSIVSQRCTLTEGRALRPVA